MNAQLKPADVTPPTTQDIAARIAAEQEKLSTEGHRDTRLTTRRSQLLAAGNDLELSACESEIAECRSAQSRSRERIELLKTQLAEARQGEETARLDELRDSAEKARQRGIDIITKTYPKLAKQLAAALAELKASEEQIDAANIELIAAKRIDDCVSPANAVRENGMREPLHQAVNLPTELSSDVGYYWEKYNSSVAVMLASVGIAR